MKKRIMEKEEELNSFFERVEMRFAEHKRKLEEALEELRKV